MNNAFWIGICILSGSLVLSVIWGFAFYLIMQVVDEGDQE